MFLPPSVFENTDKIVIIMEYASKGELYDYISERRRLSERETRHFFRQIVSAVHYCHKVRWTAGGQRPLGCFVSLCVIRGLSVGHRENLQRRERNVTVTESPGPLLAVSDLCFSLGDRVCPCVTGKPTEPVPEPGNV